MNTRLAVAAATAAVLMAGGCTGNEPSAASSPGPMPAVTAHESTSPRPSDLPDADDDHDHGLEPDLTPELTSSGPLGPDDVPAPVLLGDGWSFTVVDGDPHDTGFVSNDAATHQRDPVEVADLSVPYGCTDRSARDIVADYALDATYLHASGANGVAIRMRFGSAQQAREFLDARHAALVACTEQQPAYDGRLTVPYAARVAGATVNSRTEPAVPGHWTEIATAVDETDVLLVAVQDGSRAEGRRIARDLAEGPT